MRPSELPSERVERLLRELIEPLDSGAQLPATGDLAASLGTSKTTLRRVVDRLADEGLLVVRHGWGTFKG